MIKVDISQNGYQIAAIICALGVMLGAATYTWHVVHQTKESERVYAQQVVFLEQLAATKAKMDVGMAEMDKSFSLMSDEFNKRLDEQKAVMDKSFQKDRDTQVMGNAGQAPKAAEADAAQPMVLSPPPLEKLINQPATTISLPGWCSKAETENEKLICATPELSVLAKKLEEKWANYKLTHSPEQIAENKALLRNWNNDVLQKCVGIKSISDAYTEALASHSLFTETPDKKILPLAPSNKAITCKTRCTNGDCYRTYSDGRTVHFQAPMKLNPFTNQMEFDSGGC